MTRTEENLPKTKMRVRDSSDPYDLISIKCNMVGLRGKKMFRGLTVHSYTAPNSLRKKGSNNERAY
jgi:hypothetical protein